MIELTEEQVEVVRRELKELESARHVISSWSRTRPDLRNAVYKMSRAEGEIEQAVFGARGAS